MTERAKGYRSALRHLEAALDDVDEVECEPINEDDEAFARDVLRQAARTYSDRVSDTAEETSADDATRSPSGASDSGQAKSAEDAHPSSTNFCGLAAPVACGATAIVCGAAAAAIALGLWQRAKSVRIDSAASVSPSVNWPQSTSS